MYCYKIIFVLTCINCTDTFERGSESCCDISSFFSERVVDIWNTLPQAMLIFLLLSSSNVRWIWLVVGFLAVSCVYLRFKSVASFISEFSPKRQSFRMSKLICGFLTRSGTAYIFNNSGRQRVKVHAAARYHYSGDRQTDRRSDGRQHGINPPCRLWPWKAKAL